MNAVVPAAQALNSFSCFRLDAAVPLVAWPTDVDGFQFFRCVDSVRKS